MGEDGLDWIGLRHFIAVTYSGKSRESVSLNSKWIQKDGAKSDLKVISPPLSLH